MPQRHDPRKWVQVYWDCVARIQAGEWEAGEKIPSQLELISILGTNVDTIQRAQKDLVADGWLAPRIPGLGYYVARA